MTSLYKYPKFTTYVLHSLHGQSLGHQFFILFLKTVREADSFISFGACDQILSPRYVKDSVPYHWVCILRLSKIVSLRRL